MHEPPPGGLERLRARLAERPPQRSRIVPAVVGVIVMVVAVGLLLGRRPDSAARVSKATLDPRLISLGLQTAPSEPAVVPPEHRHEMALLRVPLRGERVVFYRLVTLPSPTTPGSPES
jgi:hypothetical protein